MPLEEGLQHYEWMGVELTRWNDHILHRLVRASAEQATNSWLDSKNGGVVDAALRSRLT